MQVVDEGNCNFPTTTGLHKTRVLATAVSGRRRLKIIPREKVKDAAQFSVTGSSSIAGNDARFAAYIR